MATHSLQVLQYFTHILGDHDAQHNDHKHKDNQHNDTQYNDTKHKGLN
jgi:hypothetical protein